MTELDNQAEKLKLLAEFYSRLEDIEEGFNKLEKETGKLMFAENAHENFAAYYRFVNPISQRIENLTLRAKLARKALRDYQAVDSSSLFIANSRKTQQKSRETRSPSSFDLLEKRVDDLEFWLQLTFLLVVTIAGLSVYFFYLIIEKIT